MRICSILLIIVGLLLMALAPFWPRIASSDAFWDESQVAEYNLSVVEMHHANSESVFDQSKTKKVEAERAQQQYRQSQAKLDRVREFRAKGVGIMRWVGGFSAVIGIGLYQISKSDDE